MNIASVLGYDDHEGPIHWLQTSWYDLIHRVMLELSIPENSQEIGNISPEEVREALIDCTGEVSRAVNKCMENRKKKVTLSFLFLLLMVRFIETFLSAGSLVVCGV